MIRHCRSICAYANGVDTTIEAFRRCIEKVKGGTTGLNREKTKLTNYIRGRDLQQSRLYGTEEKHV